MPKDVTIRAARASDEANWRRLWAGYLEFYRATLTPDVTATTWQRVLDPAASIFGRIATRNDAAVGFALYVLHPGTWNIGPICYLEDLFVDPVSRGQGVGRALIQDLIALTKSNGWERLYWHTETGNPARKLYDEFVKADEFVRYRMFLTPRVQTKSF